MSVYVPKFAVWRHSYSAVSVSDFQYDTTQWYDNFIVIVVTGKTKQVRFFFQTVEGSMYTNTGLVTQGRKSKATTQMNNNT